MLLRWRWKGEKKGGEEEEEIRKPIIYHSQTTRRKKVQHVYIYLHHTSTYVQRYKYTRDIHLPSSFLLSPRSYYKVAFNIHITTRSYYTYLHLVLLIMIIPYNNIDKPGR